jgi:hypothetical protein
MMKATELHYNHETGVVTAREPGGRASTVAENCSGLDVVAGDDVSVRVDAGMAHVESLTEEPLLVRKQKGSAVIEVLTTRRPAQDVDERRRARAFDR